MHTTTVVDGYDLNNFAVCNSNFSVSLFAFMALAAFLTFAQLIDNNSFKSAAANKERLSEKKPFAPQFSGLESSVASSK